MYKITFFLRKLTSNHLTKRVDLKTASRAERRAESVKFVITGTNKIIYYDWLLQTLEEKKREKMVTIYYFMVEIEINNTCICINIAHL